jgi:hypothetical protein
MVSNVVQNDWLATDLLYMALRSIIFSFPSTEQTAVLHLIAPPCDLQDSIKKGSFCVKSNYADMILSGL